MPPIKPWERLSERAALLMEQEREAITEQILAAIAREIPDYTRPLEGAFGRAVHTGVNQALAQFVAMMRDPGTALREEGRRVYFALGRGEVASGRSIGALLAAYRLGAQIAWRQLAEASLQSDLDQRETNLLAEAIFAYIDELSAESAEGYSQAQAERAGELDARRSELIDLLTRGRLGSDRPALRAAAEAARWQLPREVGVLLWQAELGRNPAARLPQDSILRADEEIWIALVPDPRDPARARQLQSGFAEIPAGLGTSVPVAATARSWRHAMTMLKLALARPQGGLMAADENHAALISAADLPLAGQILEQRLAALAEETPASQQRLRETLLAWLRHDAAVTPAAAELHVHPQTLRYRLARLRELLGAQLEDPDARYELEFALRATARS